MNEITCNALNDCHLEEPPILFLYRSNCWFITIHGSWHLPWMLNRYAALMLIGGNTPNRKKHLHVEFELSFFDRKKLIPCLTYTHIGVGFMWDHVNKKGQKSALLLWVCCQGGCQTFLTALHHSLNFLLCRILVLLYKHIVCYWLLLETSISGKCKVSQLVILWFFNVTMQLKQNHLIDIWC